MKYFIILFASLFLLPAQAQQIAYSSRKLEDIGEKLPQKYYPKSDSIFSSPNVLKNKSLIIAYNNKGEVSHLGVSLFSKEIKDMINRPVCNFLERLMLELVIAENKEASVRKLNEYKATIVKNSVDYRTPQFKPIVSLMDEIAAPAKFTLNLQQSDYIAEWEYGKNQVLTVKFPASRELIFGTDKNESDLELNDLLQYEPCSKTQPSLNISKTNMKYDREKNIYVKEGSFFLLKALNSDLYYNQSDNSLIPVNDKNHVTESLKNMLLGLTTKEGLKLHLKHKMYGNFTPDLVIDLDDFICLFDNDFDLYCATESKSNNITQATLVLHNKAFNYMHLLVLEASPDNIFKNKNIVKANFYSNIPQHHIKNLFGKDKSVK